MPAARMNFEFPKRKNSTKQRKRNRGKYCRFLVLYSQWKANMKRQAGLYEQ